jgi:acetylornithine deacetylase/succinyl-diaminopimelate desuccinylase-like protein
MLDKVLSTLEDDREKALAELFEFMKIPSISADSAHAGDVRRCAEWLAGLLSRDGFEVGVEETGGHPAVVARWQNLPDAPTVLVYGHYDVQPAKVEDGWSSAPFEPQVTDGRICGRGASDDKGQLFCHVAGARAHLRATGSLPVNVVMLFEGEEESGSDNLETFLIAKRDELACDAIVVSDTAQYAGGRAALTYGLRGLTYLEVTLTGPNRDLHSGTLGGVVANPANALARMVGLLVDESGRVNVPGFYDDVTPLEQWERDAWEALNYDEAALAAELGVTALFGEPGYTAVERMWARPTLDINGIWSGYTGEGAMTVIPSTAGVKLSCRLVPDQEPDKIAELVERRLRLACPPWLTMEIKRMHGAKPVLLPSKGRFVDCARAAVGAAWGEEPVFIREGGSIPVVETFVRVLDAPVVLMGFGRPDDRIHGPDERLHLADFHRGMEASARFWWELGAKR